MKQYIIIYKDNNNRNRSYAVEAVNFSKAEEAFIDEMPLGSILQISLFN